MGKLDGVRLKIAWGKRHMGRLKAALGEFESIPPYTPVFDYDLQTGEQIIKVADTPLQPPPFPGIGDVLYNFRSALDHLAWQLVDHAGIKEPGRPTAFPILDDPKKWLSKRTKDSLDGMTEPMIDLVKAHQPCFGSYAYRNHHLWGLEEYGNIDKHRFLLTTVPSFGGILWEPEGPSIFVHEGPVEKDTILARFPKGKEKRTVRPVLEVAFGEPPAAGESVYRFLFSVHLTVVALVSNFEQAFFQ